MILAAAFSPSLDVTYVVDALRPGHIHRPTQVVRCAGGKALNLVRAAHRLGGRARAVALLGGPTGDVLLGLLGSEGVEVVPVPTAQETRTCVSIAAGNTGALTEVYEHAAPVAADTWRRYVAELTDALVGTAGWLALSGGTPQDLPDDALAELVVAGRRAKVRVAVDTHGAALAAAVRERPDLVKVNRAEAAELLGVPPVTELAAMAAAVRGLTGGAVVLTDGAAGALALDWQQAVRTWLPPLEGHFPVGSGDSFLGGLLAALDAGRPLPEALVRGTAAGAANAVQPGAGRFAFTEVARLAVEVQLEVLAPGLRTGGR